MPKSTYFWMWKFLWSTSNKGKIGFTGKKKRVDDVVEECFTLFINGAYFIGKSKVGESYGDITCSRIPEFLFEFL